MKREVCPNCGGVLVAESLGWKCKSCRGFISLQDGKFYEYDEKKCHYEGTGCWEGRCMGTKEVDPCIGYERCTAFKPEYKTNADRIRTMSDEELAGQFTLIVKAAVNAFADYDLPAGICDRLWSQFLENLKQPVEEGGK